MIQRRFWKRRIEEAWQRHSVVWLCGVRRAGKTVLSQSLDHIEYFDCELPSVRSQLEDPEAFLDDLQGRRIVLDEIHRLPNPSELLKIAADHFPKTQILATGSSTLQASAKFRDTLTGRKSQVWLTPMIRADLEDFGRLQIPHRLQRGGLPPFFISPDLPEREFQDWMDSYWAKDIQELYRLERRASFQKFLELLFSASGSIFEATSYAAPCEVSRTTILNYLNVLEATWVVTVIRPFARRRLTEIVRAPKVYAFDTGFVCAFRGWHQLHREDLGYLWEQLVLNEIHGRLQARVLNYWRDKWGHEVDFIWVPRGRPPVAIECKWSAGQMEFSGLKAFRRRYPEGANWVVAQDVRRPFRRRQSGLLLDYLPYSALGDRLTARS